MFEYLWPAPEEYVTVTWGGGETRAVAASHYQVGVVGQRVRDGPSDFRRSD